MLWISDVTWKQKRQDWEVISTELLNWNFPRELFPKRSPLLPIPTHLSNTFPCCEFPFPQEKSSLQNETTRLIEFACKYLYIQKVS